MTYESNVSVEAWNTVLFDKFVRFREILTDGLRGHSDACFERHPTPAGTRVLDVGCGFGDTTLELSRAVGDRGEVTGVDCSENCGPGPFSMAGPDLVSDLLSSAGYTQISFERCDLDICIGRDLDEAVEFAIALGPAGEIIRLAGEEGAKRTPTVIAALRETLSQFTREGGIWAPSSTWFVSATNPS
jgi:hypothetical protein